MPLGIDRKLTVDLPTLGSGLASRPQRLECLQEASDRSAAVSRFAARQMILARHATDQVLRKRPRASRHRYRCPCRFKVCGPRGACGCVKWKTLGSESTASAC